MVLVVDDDDGVREALQDAFTFDGYAVCAAASGNEAIQTIADENPAIVVTDVDMDAGSGFDVLAFAAGLPAPPTVIMLSALDDPDARRRAEEMGAVGYFSKPFELTKILSVVRRHRSPSTPPS